MVKQRPVAYLLPEKVPMLFCLCWIAYFSTYLGRLDYTASMAEIIRAEGFTNSACGLVGTGFFICYGVGQLLSGIVGDKVSPKWMVFCGISVSAALNLWMGMLDSPRMMLAAWCLNGAAQSMTWSPILRTFAEYFPIEYRKQACVNISVTYPAGTLVTYGLCAALVALSGWRAVFGVVSGFMLLVAVVWLVGFTRLEKYRVGQAQDAEPGGAPARTAGAALRYTPALVLLLALISAALAMQGALRDGVMTWIPTYLSNTFRVGTTFSIAATTVLPVVNLAGAYAASAISRRLRKDEMQTSLLLFIAAGVFAGLIALAGRLSLALSVAAFSLVTSCMMGVNMMLVSFIPTYFVKWGKVSFISGLLNSMVYIGSSIAAYGIGAIADLFGWGVLLAALIVAAVLGVAVCALGAPRWRAFVREAQTDGEEF